MAKTPLKTPPPATPLPRVLKTKWFVRAAQQEGISDAELCEAAREVARGVGDDLGGGLWKKRVGLGHARAVILTKSGTFWVYQVLYAKDKSSNISRAGKLVLRKQADDYVATLTTQSVAGLLKNQGWKEICNNG